MLKAIIVLCFTQMILIPSAVGQGAPMRDFFQVTAQTTKADAHQYLKRVLPTIVMRDKSGRDFLWRVETYTPASRYDCGANLKIVRRKRSNSPTLRASGFAWSYIIDFRQLVDVSGDQESIKLRGLMDRDIEQFFEDRSGEVDRRQQPADQVQGLSILIASDPYDVVNALAFLGEKCGGGSKFRR